MQSKGEIVTLLVTSKTRKCVNLSDEKILPKIGTVIISLIYTLGFCLLEPKRVHFACTDHAR